MFNKKKITELICELGRVKVQLGTLQAKMERHEPSYFVDYSQSRHRVPSSASHSELAERITELYTYLGVERVTPMADQPGPTLVKRPPSFSPLPSVSCFYSHGGVKVSKKKGTKHV